MEEQDNVLQEYTGFQYDYAGAGIRFLNYLIDTITFYILSAIIGVIGGIVMVSTGTTFSADSGGAVQLLFLFAFLFIIILYYTVLEGSKGKTLGKLITKTKVVTEDGDPITYKQAFLRTLTRFVPFEPFSAFFGLTMWHDQWTRTVVVKDKKPI